VLDAQGGTGGHRSTERSDTTAHRGDLEEIQSQPRRDWCGRCLLHTEMGGFTTNVVSTRPMAGLAGLVVDVHCSPKDGSLQRVGRNESIR